MEKKQSGLRSHCPVNFGLEAIGDRWALLILRDIIFSGKRAYGEFLKSREGFSTNILASRLDHLLAEGILRRDGDAADGRKLRYSMTEKGLDLIPMIFEMILWSARHDGESEARRIPGLVKLIQSDNRAISRKVREQVRKGEAILGDYLA